MREDICDTYSSQRVVTKNMLKKKLQQINNKKDEPIKKVGK